MKLIVLFYSGFVILYCMFCMGWFIYQHEMGLVATYFLALSGYFGWFFATLRYEDSDD